MIQKQTRLRTLILLCLWGCCCYMNAQTTNGIGVTLVDYNLNSNHEVNLGYTITLHAEVTNFDSTPFSGVVNFGLRDSYNTFTTSSIFDKPPYSGNSIQLAGHETVPAIFSVYVSPSDFVPGPDVVVVWPLCTSPYSDSIKLNITILDPSTVNDPAAGTFTYAIIQGKLLMRTLNTNLVFEQVRIYDMLGRPVASSSGSNVQEISLANLAKGIYTCQIRTTTGEQFAFKFFN